MKRILLALGAVVVLLAPAAAQANIVSRLGVSIESCVVNQNGSGATNGINVVYYNTHPSPATEVDFVIGYRGHRFTMVDRGTFTQGAKISHDITNDLMGFAWSGPVPNMCKVNRVYLQDGTVLGP